MLRKVFIKTIAVATAIPMAVAMPAMTVLAEDNESTQIAAVQAINDQDVVNETTIDAPEDKIGIYAGGNGSTVTQTGDVTTTDAASVLASEHSKVIVNGDVTSQKNDIGANTVNASESFVEINGDVTSEAQDAIVANNGSEIHVDGNVVAESVTANESGHGIKASDSQVTVSKDVVSDENFAIVASGDSEIFVQKDADGRWVAYETLDDKSKDGILEIYGTAKSDRTTFAFDVTDTDQNPDNITNYLPKISIYKIEQRLTPKNGNGIVSVRVSNSQTGTLEELGADESAAYSEAIIKQINYIIHADKNVALETASIDHTYLNAPTTKYYTAEEAANGAGFMVDVCDGYELSYDSSVVVVTKARGNMYRVTLINPYGGLNLTAIRKAVAEQTGVPEEKIEVEVQNTEDSQPSSTDDSYGAPAGAIKISSGNIPSANVVPAIEGAATPSRAVSVNVQNLTPVQYQNVFINNVASTPAGTMLRFETNTVSVLDSNMINAIASNPTIDVEVLFTYNGQKLRVVIPAGYDVSKLLDEKGYCGFLRLASLLGSQVIDA